MYKQGQEEIMVKPGHPVVIPVIKRQGISKLEVKKYIIVAYCTAFVLFLAEYIYYKVTVAIDVVHYNNFLLFLHNRNTVTQYSGLYVIALFIVALMPLIIFILKRKTLLRLVLFIIIYIIYLLMCMILAVVIASSDKFAHQPPCYFDKSGQPGGGIIICSQITQDFYYDEVNVYVETGYNTLKEIRNIHVPRETRQEIYWDDGMVNIILYKEGRGKKIKVEKHLEITLDELNNVI